MNSCRNCRKLIPNRLCFCSTCMPLLTQSERQWLLVATSTQDREQFARNIVARLNGESVPDRKSLPPGDAVEAFREARRILAPILGKKP